jgi:hypothetical protein
LPQNSRLTIIFFCVQLAFGRGLAGKVNEKGGAKRWGKRAKIASEWKEICGANC